MCEVEVELPVERHPECGGHEEGEVVCAGGRHLVAVVKHIVIYIVMVSQLSIVRASPEVGDPARGAAVEVGRLPDRVLGHPQQRVPHVVQHLDSV